MKFWRPGEGPLQRSMRQARERGQANWRRNLEGGYYLQQKAKREALLRGSSLGRSSLPRSDLGLGSQVKPLVKIQRVWAEHNIGRGDKKGMRIHTAFSVTDVLRRTGIVAARFYFASGVPLMDLNGSYRTRQGNVCVVGPFTPSSITTSYEDFVLFMPYLELHRETGEHSLKFLVTVWDNQSRELARSDWVHFTYTRG